MKRSKYEELHDFSLQRFDDRVLESRPLKMGFAPGGLMRQEICEDDYGIDAVGHVDLFAVFRAYRQ